MQERQDHDERIHQRIWDLLPWYVNGTLSGPDRERVEDHMPECRRCQDEVETCRRMAVSIKGLGDVAPSPHPVQLQRVLARIDRMEEDTEAGQAMAGERPEPLASAGPRFGAPRRALQALVAATPRPLRGALMAQAAIIVLLVGLLAWIELRPAPALYQTLSDPARVSGGTVAVRVMFSPQATEEEIRDLLLAVHGEITAGPSPLGAYTVEVTAADPVSVVLTRLRSDSLVTFAQPAAGGAPGRRGR